jgi:hypothetical protein
VTLTDNGDGTITAEADPENGTYEFVNTYQTSGSITFSGTKKLVNRALVGGEFEFVLYETAADFEVLDGQVALERVKNDKDGHYAFSTIVYTGDADLKTGGKGNYATGTKYYKVVEAISADKTVIHDGTEYNITVTLEDNREGKIIVTADPAEDTYDFTNIVVKVSKVDVTTQKELENALIQIYETDENGNKTRKVFEFTSGKEATDIKGLEVGKTYILHEEVAPDGYTITSDTTFTVDATGKVTSTGSKTTDQDGNTVLLVEDAKTHVEVSKVDVADGKELEGATIQILKELKEGEEETEGKTYIEENGKKYEVVEEWVSEKEAHVIEGLLTNTEYILREEVAPNGYLIAAETTFTVNTDGTITASGSKTTDKDGNEILLVEDTMKKVSATVRKVWDDDGNRDGLRPASITVNLLANGEKKTSVVLNEANHWTATVKNLPAVDGECKDIAYVWEEPAAGIGYKLTGNVVTGDKTVGTLTTLTNSREADKVPVSVRKVWTDDNDAAKKRPASIEVQLYADGKAEGAPVVLNAANGWTYTWEGLSKNIRENGLTRAIAYTVAETEIPEGYVGKVSGNAGDGFVITNTYDTGKLVIEKEFDIAPFEPEEPDTTPIDIPVIKTWNDNNNADGNRPASVTVRLYANGAEVASAELNDANNWRYTFTEMPRLTEEGEEIAYTISEDAVEWYTAEINGFNIRNNYEPELTSVAVRKVWVDNGNATRQRPASIVMTLSNGMNVILNAANNWSATIENLPTRINGQPAVYTWTEQPVIGYTLTGEETVGNLTTFTNTLWVRPEPPTPGRKVPPTPGTPVETIEEYETPLGVEIVINHVGDCFD